MISVGVVIVTWEFGGNPLLVLLVVMTIRWVLSSFNLSLLFTRKLEMSSYLAVNLTEHQDLMKSKNMWYHQHSKSGCHKIYKPYYNKARFLADLDYRKNQCR